MRRFEPASGQLSKINNLSADQNRTAETFICYKVLSGAHVSFERLEEVQEGTQEV